MQSCSNDVHLAMQANKSNRGYFPFGEGTAKNPYAQLDRKEALNLYLGEHLPPVPRCITQSCLTQRAFPSCPFRNSRAALGSDASIAPNER